MASSVTVKTQAVTRDVLAQMAGNQRLIKLLENLTFDVTVTLPDGIDELQQDLATAASATAIAQAIAALALITAAQATEGPPVMAAVLPDTPDDMAARLAALESRVADLARAVAEIAGDPTP